LQNVPRQRIFGQNAISLAEQKRLTVGHEIANQIVTIFQLIGRMCFKIPDEIVNGQLQIREIFYEYTDLVEPLSLDEAYLDVTFNKKNNPSATNIAKEIRKKIFEKIGKKVTITDIISLAVIRTLMKHKYVNSSLTEDGNQIILHNYVNLAIAVGMDGGLLVPVIKNADKMTLSELVVKSKEIVSKALEMKLSPDEQSGSTFTISNLGMYGVQSFNPVINQPNSAILGVSGMIDKPVAVNGEIVIRPIMTLCLTIDHRVVDGLAGAKFMQDLKNLLENPISMLV